MPPRGLKAKKKDQAKGKKVNFAEETDLTKYGTKVLVS